MIARVLFVLMTLFMLNACEEQGPAESLGEEIDEGAEAAQETAEEAGEEVNEALGN